MDKKLVHGGDIYSNSNGFTDFSANINPLGLPNGVKRAIIDNIDKYESYPDPLCRELRRALEISSGVPFDNIACGNGAADLIFRLVLCLKPKKAVVLAPTFAEYEEALKLVDCEIIYHRLLEKNGFELDTCILSKITSDIDIVFICNPNNPTGIPVKSELVLKIAEMCKEKNVTLAVDECFNDFLENEQEYSVVDKLLEYPDLVILKAFTKFYAMAGIRLGYMLCGNSRLAEKIAATLQPWSVSTIASKCGVAALLEDDYKEKTRVLIKENRKLLIEMLKEIGFKVYNSKANFIFFKSTDTALASKLKEKKILIRECDNYIGLNDKNGYYRVAVKGMSDNIKLISCLKEIL